MALSLRAGLSAKPRPMILSRTWHAIVRATAALLLLATFVTPALAEVACAEESIVHLEDSRSSAVADDHRGVSEEGQPNEGENGQLDHCAFSHGHCAGIAVGSGRSEPAPSAPAKYASLTAQPLTARSPAAPERPPAA